MKSSKSIHTSTDTKKIQATQLGVISHSISIHGRYMHVDLGVHVYEYIIA